MNVISKSTIAKFDFRIKLYRRPFRMTWVDRTSLIIIHRRLVSLSGVHSFGGTFIAISYQ